jgi:hypothetical protein
LIHQFLQEIKRGINDLSHPISQSQLTLRENRMAIPTMTNQQDGSHSTVHDQSLAILLWHYQSRP